MGKTVQIDDDVLAAAEKIAAERGVSPGEVISDAARKALAGAVADPTQVITRPAAGKARDKTNEQTGFRTSFNDR